MKVTFTVSVGFILSVCTGLWAVQTSFLEHNTEEQFKQGKTDSILISNTGELSLAYRTSTLLADSNDIWTVNAIVENDDGDIYVGTSGQGHIYRLASPELEPELLFHASEQQDVRHVFSLALDAQGRVLAGTGGERACLLRETDTGEFETIFSDDELNYIWNIAIAATGHIYLGTGPTGRVLMLDQHGQNPRVLYEAQEKNILSLAIDDNGILYAGGDEFGLVYRIDVASGTTTVVYDSDHSEISSLAFDRRGNLYIATADAGTGRPAAELILSDGDAGRPALPLDQESPPSVDGPESPGELPSPGKPTEPSEPDESNQPGQPEHPKGPEPPGDSQPPQQPEPSNEPQPSNKLNPQRHNAPATDQTTAAQATSDNNHDTNSPSAPHDEDATKQLTPPVTPPATTNNAKDKAVKNGSRRPAIPGRKAPGPNDVYMVSPDGYVRTVFHRPVIILGLATTEPDQLLLATGNEGQLLRLDLPAQQAVVLHTVESSIQISAVLAATDGTIYAGCSNPAALIALEGRLAQRGEYVSPPLDAGQISRWGSLQIEADIPEHTQLMISTRTGNTDDPDLNGWQPWTEPSPGADSISLDSPPGRFLQYKLILTTDTDTATPVVREVKVAHMVPNLPPRVTSVTVVRDGNQQTGETAAEEDRLAGKVMTVHCKAIDENDDELTFSVFLRPIGGPAWIRVADDLDSPKWRWDSRTVADGRYEIKVQTSDSPSNPPDRALTDARISRPIVVDNTPPEVADFTVSENNEKTIVHLGVRDALSTIAAVAYCVDSAENWQVTLPIDGVFDSRHESVTFPLELDKPGPHLLTLRIDDASGNRTYRNRTMH